MSDKEILEFAKNLEKKIDKSIAKIDEAGKKLDEQIDKVLFAL